MDAFSSVERRAEVDPLLEVIRQGHDDAREALQQGASRTRAKRSPARGPRIGQEGEVRMKVTVMTASGALSFQATPGESLLAAALRHGVALPYECATGTCGTCGARLLDGEIDAGWPAAPARQALKLHHSEFLTCQAEPRGDCTLRPLASCGPWPDGVERPAAYEGWVALLQPLARDILRLVVETGRPLAFQAGQFALVQVPGVDGARAYSMANPQSYADRLEFVIKRKPDGGVSRWLFETAAPGDVVRLFGPLGAAVFEPALGHDLLLAVGGSGLAVALAVLGRADAAGYLGQHRARLFFGARSMRDVCLLEQLSRWRERHGEALQVTVALSDVPPTSADQAAWPALLLETGMVHEVVQRRMSASAGNDMAFVAGPPPMVEATLRSLVLHARFPPARIRFDKFS